MEYLKEFYGSLSNRRKILLWICVFFIFLSIVKITAWASKGGVPGPREFTKKLASESIEEKKFAIYEVGRLGVKAAVPSLVRIVKEDARPDIKRAAATSLGKVDKEQLLSLLDGTPKNVKYTVMETLIKLDRDNVSQLMERFDREDAETKMFILSYIDTVTDPAYRDRMLSVGEDASQETAIRIQALRMTGKYQLDSATESRLWNIYYNDNNRDIKNLAYTLIKEGRKKTANQATAK